MFNIKNRLAKLSPEQREVLIKNLKQSQKTNVKKVISKRPDDVGYPLSFQQKRLWFMHQLDSKSSFYNMPITVQIEGNINWPAIEFALNEIIRRHEVLRSIFPMYKGEPHQKILDSLILNIKREKIIFTDKYSIEKNIRREISTPFDLSTGPLIRVRVFELNEKNYILVLTLHHIVADGWSVGVFIEEFSTLYSAFNQGMKAKILPELKIQYADYAYWQNQWLQSEQKNKQLAYWKNQLANAPSVLNLPYDYPRPVAQTYNGAHLAFSISHSVTASLRELSKTEEATLYMILLAAFQVLLFRYSNQYDLNIGTAIANRERPEISKLIGFFINTIVISGYISANLSFKQYLQKVKQTALDAFDNQELPFELLLEELHIERNASYSPLFQVLFVLQNMPQGQLQLPDVKLSILHTQIGSVKYDLTLTMEESGDSLNGLLGYNTDLFKPETTQRMVNHFKYILREIAFNPDLKIEDIPLMDENEKKLLIDLHQTKQEYDHSQIIHQLFEKQVKKTPNAVAIIQPKADPLNRRADQWTYNALNKSANRIAHFLISRGVQNENKIGICMDRSPQMIAAMLAILKAGCAYVPIDPSYPQERIDFIVKDANVNIILTQSSLLEKFKQLAIPTIMIDESEIVFEEFSSSNPDILITAHQLAYVIYTSGSTGIPKGVEVEHRQLVNYIHAAAQKFALSAADKVLQFASISFDAAAEEIYPTLSRGAGLVLRNEAMISSSTTFLNSIKKFGITILDLPTAYWHQLAEAVLDQNLSLPEKLRLVIIGGERALPERVRGWQHKFAGRMRLLNTYGPTETTVVATWWEAPEAPADVFLFPGEVPIGRAIPNGKVYVLDSRLRPLPVGVPGELFIGGNGVARGYLNRPDLTAEKFVANPFIEGERLYRSGDLVRWLADGNLEYLGRIDQQVKIRGFRIELGEIESALQKHPAVAQAVLQAREDSPGDRRLAAYYTCKPGKGVQQSELRTFLKAELPEYMLPSYFVQLDDIPLTTSGKINYRALPAPEHDRSSLEQVYEAPRNELENLLVEILQDVLGLERIGIRDNFFELGGDSLKAAVFINRLQQALDEILYVVVLFDHQTIGDLADYLIDTYPQSVLRFVKTRFPQPGIESRITTLLQHKTEINQGKINEMKRLLGRYTGDEAQESAFLQSITKKNKRAVFIVSAPRSGSTLLRVMLAGNPRLFSPPELALLNFRTLKERYKRFAGRDVGWMEGLYRAVMEIHQCDFETSKKIVAEYEEKEYTTAAFYGVLQKWLDGRMIVDKTTTYATDVRILQRAEAVFEEPFYIHLVRHPAAMIQSYLDSNLDQVFGADLPFTVREKAEMFWLINNQNVQDFFEKVPEQRRYFLRYEDLVQNPQQAMRDLCHKLEIDFDPEMLNPYGGDKMRDGVHEQSKMVGDPRFNSHKTIDPNLAFKWQTLPEGDRLSSFSTELAISLGYTLAEKDRTERKIVLKPLDRSRPLPLSFAQQRLWFLDQLEPGQANYNIPASIRIHGQAEVAALIRAIRLLAERHEALRTIFVSEDGKAKQVIVNDLVIPVEKIRLNDTAEPERMKKALQIIRAEARSPFDLSKGPLIRVKLIELAEDDHILMMNMHHIISDGWSVGIIIRDLIELYRSQIENRPPLLPELALQYADYAVWQRQRLSGSRLQEELCFWEEQIKDAPELIELPYDRPRPPVQTFNGRRLSFRLSAQLSRSLLDLAKELESTPFMILMAAFQLLLHRYSGQETVLVGTPVANRSRREIENVVGFFVNTLVLRADFRDDPTFAAFLEQVKQHSSAAFAHQELPFEKIVDSLKIERNLSHNPVFQVMFAYQPPLLEKMDISELRFEPVDLDAGIAKFDLTVSMAEHDGRLSGVWEFNTDLWYTSTIERMMGHFENLLQGLVRNPTRPVSRYTLLNVDEQKQIIEDFNAVPPVDYPHNVLLHELFERQVERTPDNIALVYKGQTMTYRELNEKANQLAHYLLKKGVKAEQLVGISLDRSFDLLITMYGILKTGAAYVPLDPSYPPDRLSYMIEDSGLKVIVTQQRFTDIFIDLPVKTVTIDEHWPHIAAESRENPALKLSSQNLCYVIYTSGSTGWPKGVQVQHNTVIILAYNYIHRFKLNENKRLIQYFSYSFDGSVGDFFMGFFAGASLYLVDKKEALPDSGLIDLLRDAKITTAILPPSLLSVLPAEQFPELTMLASGGDVCSPELARKWASATRKYYNAYGPTETTVCATWYLTNRLPKEAAIVPIGKPIPHYRTYILDKHLNPLPIGVAGEMFICGKGITRGYLNKSDLTAEKFLPDLFSKEPGARMYASGDLCRYLPDGNIEFLGRIDQQVKIRGFRIEPGEIEAALLDHPAINEAVVLAKGPAGNKQLAAYLVTAKEEEINIGDIRAFLKNRLPEYMIPAYFMFLDKMPLTGADKLDKKQLPEPEISRESLQAEFIAARNEKEKILATVWRELLHLEKVGIKDNFFELGGDSILSIQVIARAKQAGLKITPKQLFEHPTIEALAEAAEEGVAVHAEQGLVSGRHSLTPIQGWFFEKDFLQPNHWNQALMIKLNRPLKTDALKKTLQAIVVHHDVLRTRFFQNEKKLRMAEIGKDGEIPLTVERISENDDRKDLQEKGTLLQTSLDIEKGPLMRAGYFYNESDQYLMLALHHLAVDGVSWRILLEDFQAAYMQAEQSPNKEIELPPKTTSFKYWAEKLTYFANNTAILSELEYWRSLTGKKAGALPVDFPQGENLEKFGHSVQVELSEEETKALLREAPAAYRTQMNELLLAALILAYSRRTGKRRLLIELEGHGREDLFEEVDISRTVGWFTSVYPFYLEINRTQIGDIIKQVKEQYRRIPRNGIGFGLLKYLADKDIRKQMQAIAEPAIGFNYLGQFDQSAGDIQNIGAPLPAPGRERGKENQRVHLLEIGGSVFEGKLRFTWSFSAKVFRAQTIERWAEDYITALREVIDHCLRPESGGYTPSDFADVELAEEELDDLLSELDDDLE